MLFPAPPECFPWKKIPASSLAEGGGNFIRLCPSHPPVLAATSISNILCDISSVFVSRIQKNGLIPLYQAFWFNLSLNHVSSRCLILSENFRNEMILKVPSNPNQSTILCPVIIPSETVKVKFVIPVPLEMLRR